MALNFRLLEASCDDDLWHELRGEDYWVQEEHLEDFFCRLLWLDSTFIVLVVWCVEFNGKASIEATTAAVRRATARRVIPIVQSALHARVESWEPSTRPCPGNHENLDTLHLAWSSMARLASRKALTRKLWTCCSLSTTVFSMGISFSLVQNACHASLMNRRGSI